MSSTSTSLLLSYWDGRAEYKKKWEEIIQQMGRKHTENKSIINILLITPELEIKKMTPFS